MATKTYEYRFLDDHQLNALQTFANANGVTWKSKLNTCWATGRYDDYNGTENSGYLQQVRNQFGPSWLARFLLKDTSTHKVRK